MTQIFSDDGTVIPITVVSAGQCTVTQVKIQEKDGYSAVQVGVGERRKINKPMQGLVKNLKIKPELLKEFRVDDPSRYKVGDSIDVSVFEKGDKIDVIGISKGLGFQGVVKRHGFHGQNSSHGHKDQERAPGSIGSTDSSRVFKGTRMAGQMGNKRVTVKNLKVIAVDSKKSEIQIKGAVPGARGSLVMLKSVRS